MQLIEVETQLQEEVVLLVIELREVQHQEVAPIQEGQVPQEVQVTAVGLQEVVAGAVLTEALAEVLQEAQVTAGLLVGAEVQVA